MKLESLVPPRSGNQEIYCKKGDHAEFVDVDGDETYVKGQRVPGQTSSTVDD